MTASREPVSREPRQVWAAPSPLGYLESIQAAGALAAPLLAGASFTLAALTLQASQPFARWPGIALVCFVTAGVAQVFAVECVIWARGYTVTPDELRQWYSEHFGTDESGPDQWLRNMQREQITRARLWARRTRWSLNAGLLALLVGITLSVIPPGRIGGQRWGAIVVAALGALVELRWAARLVRADVMNWRRDRADWLRLRRKRLGLPHHP
jgi:hypothetical protein